jgi:hypothetical protein
VRHELAFASLPYPAMAMALQSLNASFQNPPLVVQAARHGQLRCWEVFQENMPLSSLQVGAGGLLARFYNPTPHEAALSRSYPQANVWGEVQGETAAVLPKKIANLRLETTCPGAWEAMESAASPVVLLSPPQWRAEPSHGAPDPAVLVGLEEKIAGLDAQLGQVAADLALEQGASQEARRTRLQLEHRQYALQRERLEYQLSLLLNRRALEYGGETPQEVLYQLDPEIAAVGKELNRLRIKRRIYDYVVQALD